MKFRRIVTTISAQFSDLVDQVENHEAVAAAALEDFRVGMQEVKVQLRLLEKELKVTQAKSKESELHLQQWKSRAQSYATSDRSKALECTRRYRSSLKEQEFWSQKEATLVEDIERLASELREAEAKYQNLKLEYLKYTSRDRSAQVRTTIPVAGSSKDSVGEVFERWDKKIIRCEVRSELGQTSYDPLMREIEKEEEDLDLESTLNELTTESEK